MAEENRKNTPAQNDNTKTGKYSFDDSVKTGLYETSSDKTSLYGDKETASKSKAHGLSIGDSIRLKGKEYKILEVISEGTGEAVIYKIEDSGKNISVLKLYHEFRDYKEEPSFETLTRIKGINDPDILKLIDFGLQSDKYEGKYCYEISEYAQGGNLLDVENIKEKYTPKFVETNVVREIFKGIKKLHDYKIFHCDLKPGNIYYKDKSQTDLIIGDYGSAKAYGLESEKEIRKTSTVKGTQIYRSPEQSSGIVSERNDYFSFGMVLLHLLYPDSLTDKNDFRKIDKDKFEKIIERQFSAKPIIEYQPALKRLNSLIAGLTMANQANRWGKTEVEKWLNGEDVEVKYISSEGKVQPIKLGYTTIINEENFCNVLEKNNKWWEDLFEDLNTYRTVLIWMDSYKDIPTRKIFDGIVSFYKPLGKDFLKDALLRYFNHDRVIQVDMNRFDFVNSNNMKPDVDSFISKLDEIWKITSPDKLRFYIFQLEFSLLQLRDLSGDKAKLVLNSLIEKIYSVFGLVQKPFDDFKTQIQTKLNPSNEADFFHSILKLFYLFNTNRTFKDLKGFQLKTLIEVGLFFAKYELDFTNKYLSAERIVFIEKLGLDNLNKLDYKSFIFEVFKSETESQVDVLKLSFDKQRNYTVFYKYYKTLNPFFAKRDIKNVDFTLFTDSDNNNSYKIVNTSNQQENQSGIAQLPEGTVAGIVGGFIRLISFAGGIIYAYWNIKDASRLTDKLIVPAVIAVLAGFFGGLIAGAIISGIIKLVVKIWRKITKKTHPYVSTENSNVYQKRRKFLHSFTSVYRDFMSTVFERHGIASLPEENIKTVKKIFKWRSRKIYFYMYRQRIAFLLFVLMLAGGYQYRDYLDTQKRNAEYAIATDNFVSVLDLKGIKIFNSSQSENPSYLSKREFRNTSSGKYFSSNKIKHLYFAVDLSYPSSKEQFDLTVDYFCFSNKNGQLFYKHSLNISFPGFSRDTYVKSKLVQENNIAFTPGTYTLEFYILGRRIGKKIFSVRG